MRTFVSLVCLLLLFAIMPSVDSQIGIAIQRLLCRIRGCPNLRFDCRRMQSVCANMRNAINNRGKPILLTRQTNRLTIALNRVRSGCVAMGATRPYSCDEYPFASTNQGGRGSVIARVPLIENQRQGGQISAFYRRNRIGNGNCFCVIV